MTIFTHKPNLFRSWLRHIQTKSWQNPFRQLTGTILNFFKNSFGKLKPSKNAKVFNFKLKKIKLVNINHVKKSPIFQNDFILRHAGLFILVAIVILANYLTSKSAEAITQDYNTEISLSQTAAVSQEDFSNMITKINNYTPAPIKQEDSQKVVQRLILKDSLVMADENFITKPSILTTSLVSDGSLETSSESVQNQISEYIVQQGETLSSIAKKFGISADTIKSANNLSSDIIKPGQKLTILPGDGILHIVKQGETLSGIVSTYSGDLHSTIQKNGLSQVATIFAGQKIVVIGGKRPVSTAVAAASSKKANTSRVAGIQVNRAKGPNYFPFGWCTWYVASRRYVPWRGNAGAWPANARAMGYKVGRVPVPGAIIVTHESRWGHVGYVESVSGNSVTISEMNFTRWGRVNFRTVSASYGVYIY